MATFAYGELSKIAHYDPFQVNIKWMVVTNVWLPAIATIISGYNFNYNFNALRGLK